jgi:hypothetical protein
MRVLYGFAFFFISVLVMGKERPYADKITPQLGLYINIFSQIDGSIASTEDFARLIHKLEQKENHLKKEDFLRLVFFKTRQKFLRHFSEYASFSETLSKGKYNCLTGTALYALLLKHFDIRYQIVETNYHIFLLVTTAEGKFLFDATDPQRGFVADAGEIEKRILQYRQNRLPEVISDKKYYRYNFNLYNEVSLDEMAGLLYYNRSVKAYNDHDLPFSIDLLGNAQELYNSPRVTEFSTILLLTVIEGKLDKATKANYLKNIQTIRRKQLPILARN